MKIWKSDELSLLNIDLDTLDMEWQLEELDKQLEELKQQATPKFRLVLIASVIHVILLVFMNCYWHLQILRLEKLFLFLTPR